MSIEVKGLTKIYGSQRAVDNIHFSINKGEIVGFLGPNGAGKSTTMKMITGYLQPDAGSAVVSGIDVAKQPLQTKKKIGYLPESNALYYDMYVREYLGFVAELHGIGGKKQAVEKVIQTTGLTPESHKRIGQLSKGYKQRVGIAAALIHDPEVLILDEPTSGLDPNQIVEIRQVIKDQGKDKIILFSSHILQEVEAICDRVIIINKGKIVADDRMQNLQSLSTSNVVRVGFKEALETEWLRRLPSARLVDKTDTYHWSIETDEPEALRKQILEMSLQHNLNIVSLQSQNLSLEEVFRDLTSKEANKN
ncbi:MAG TPA: gliding motility-associated ABC transporter ATP-binding subunit GldA [Chitinophagaceae bacterium]|nr:gliding motility-associated ABC transporter ATP-binding subunit GldA [Chitinophagaceae bacterium]